MFLSLSELRKGQWGIVDAFVCGVSLSLKLRLQEVGLTPGTWVQLMRKAPQKGPIQVKIGAAFVALRQAEAQCLRIRIA
jgi:Fe2+ transport system protein FeoA